MCLSQDMTWISNAIYVVVFFMFNVLRWNVTSFWWYWWDCWLSLFKISLHNSDGPVMVDVIVFSKLRDYDHQDPLINCRPHKSSFCIKKLSRAGAWHYLSKGMCLLPVSRTNFDIWIVQQWKNNYALFLFPVALCCFCLCVASPHQWWAQSRQRCNDQRRSGYKTLQSI